MSHVPKTDVPGIVTLSFCYTKPKRIDLETERKTIAALRSLMAREKEPFLQVLLVFLPDL